MKDSLRGRFATFGRISRQGGACTLLLCLLFSTLLHACKDASSPSASSSSKDPSPQPNWEVLFTGDPEAFNEFKQIQAQLRVSNYRGATGGLQKLLARSPKAPWAEPLEFMLMQAWRMVPDYQEALKQADAFLERYPASRDIPRVMLYKGEVLLELGKQAAQGGRVPSNGRSSLEQAEQIFQSLPRLYPTDRVTQAQAWYMLGATYFAMADFQKAKGAYQKVADEYADTSYPPKALYRLAGVLLSEGSTEAAGGAFRAITERFPESREAEKAREKLAGIAMVGSKAPALAVREWLGGESVKMEDCQGQVLLLNFWAIWCPHCRNNLPRMSRLMDLFGFRGLRVVGISRERSGYEVDKIRQFIDAHPMGFPTGVDDESRTSDAYAVANVPCVVAVDRNGTVRWHGHPDYLTDQVVEALLGSQS
jgi:outer membrane protein assembly factor BamD (BamD/ComL family)